MVKKKEAIFSFCIITQTQPPSLISLRTQLLISMKLARHVSTFYSIVNTRFVAQTGEHAGTHLRFMPH